VRPYLLKRHTAQGTPSLPPAVPTRALLQHYSTVPAGRQHLWRTHQPPPRRLSRHAVRAHAPCTWSHAGASL